MRIEPLHYSRIGALPADRDRCSDRRPAGAACRARSARARGRDTFSTDAARLPARARGLSGRCLRRRRSPPAHRRDRRHRRGRTRVRRGRDRWHCRAGPRSSPCAKRPRTARAACPSGAAMGRLAGDARAARRAARRRQPGCGARARRRPRPAYRRHDYAAGVLGSPRRPGTRSHRRILAAHAEIPENCAAGLAGDPQRTRRDRAGRTPRPPDRGGSGAPCAGQRTGDRRRLDRLHAGDRHAACYHRPPAARRRRAAGLDTDLDEESWELVGGKR